MKKKTSKLLSLTLSLALCLSLVPTVAFAAEQPTEGPVEVTEMGPPMDATGVVAKIGDVTYTSIQDAIDAANGESTIVVQDDVKYYEFAPLTVKSDKTIILDLNGHTVSQEFKEKKNSALLTNHGTLTIVDSAGNGKLTAKATSPDGQPFKYGNYTIDNHGTLIVVSGTVENTTTAASNAAGAATYAVNSISDKGTVSVTLNGGTLVHSGNGNSIRQMALSAEHENNLTVNDGTTLSGGIFQQLAPSGDAAAKANLTMNGGELSGYYAINQNSTNGKFDNACITVTGGTVHGAISINWPFSGNATVNAGHVRITGGTFDRTGFDKLSSIFDIYSKITGETKFITGGTYVEDPSAYVPATHKATEANGTWTVAPFASGNIDTNPGADGSVVIGGTPSDEDKANHNVTIDVDKDKENTNATVNQETVKALADSGVSLTMKNQTAEVTIPAEAMKDVTAEVKVEIKKVDVTQAAAAVEVNVTAGGKNLMPEGETNNGTVTITIPVTVEEGKTPIVYYVMGDSSSLIYVNKIASTYKNGQVTFTTDHLSKYVVTTEEKDIAEASYTAADGTVAYGTLADAFKNVQAGGTVTLRKDIAVSTNTGYTVSNEKNFTLELNGCTITQTVSEKKASALFTNKGILNIKDSSGYKGGLVAQIGENADPVWKYGNYIIDNHGTITLDCNITETISGKHGAAIALNNASGSKMTIDGGTIKGDSTAIRVYAKSNDQSTDLTINGGTIISPDPIWVQADSATKPAANVIVTDGEIRSSGRGSNGPTTIRTTHTDGKSHKTGLDGIQIAVSGGKLTGGNIDLGAPWNNEKTDTGEKLTITGGEIDGIVVHTEGSSATHEGEVTGGIFKTVPTDMIESNSPVADVTNSNGKVTAVGDVSIGSAAKQKGVTQITVTQGDVTLENISADVAVKNSGSGKVTVNGTDIPKSDVASYSVTVDTVVNGTASVDKPFAKAGDTVTITANPDTGYHFAGVTVTNTGDSTSIPVSDCSFTMPAGHVKVVVTFQANGSSGGGSGSGGSGGGSISTPSYSVSAERTTNGTVSITPVKAAKGDTVTLTVIPDKGYELDSLKVMDKDGKAVQLTDKGNGKFTFTMPSGKVSVKATFRVQQQSWVNPFYDVDSNAYYYDAVAWAAQNGITSGTSAFTFSPDAQCTRAQIVTFLWNAAGSPAPHGSQKAFKDVPADSYYATAVLWAVENGITSGTSATTFSPNATCTRAQAVTFLHRSQNAPAVGSGTAFGDVAADAYYASAVSWAAQNGITGGTGANTFSPDASCTRAQIVTFLYRTFVK